MTAGLATSRYDARSFIEDCGLFFEELGLTRMAGRVLGRLLICDAPHESAAELAAALHASAGSISGATRLLIGYRLIERLSLPGDRRDYFRLRPGVWVERIRERMLVTHRFKAIAARGLEIAGDAGPQRARLHEVERFFDVVEEAQREAIYRWERERRTRS